MKSWVEMELVLQDFYEASKLSEEDVLCVYLVGSRLIGISRPDSDYDLKVVVKNSYTGPRNFHHLVEFDIHLYTLSEFLSGLHEHDLQLLVCLYLPPEFKWREDVTWDPFFLRLKKLGSATKLEATRNWGKSFRLWKAKEKLEKQISEGGEGTLVDEHHNHSDTPKDLEHKARKGIVHALRFAFYGIQLVTCNQIYNYSESNEIFWEVMATPENTPPSFFEKKYKPILDGLLHTLKKKIGRELTQHPILKSQKIFSDNSRKRLREFEDPRDFGDVVDFLNSELPEFENIMSDTERENSDKTPKHLSKLLCLSRVLQIKIQKCNFGNSSEIFFIKYSDKSPMDFKLSRDCSDLVIRWQPTTQIWQLVACGSPTLIWLWPEQFLENVQENFEEPNRLLNLDWERVTSVHENPARGFYVTFFWDSEKWRAFPSTEEIDCLSWCCDDHSFSSILRQYFPKLEIFFEDSESLQKTKIYTFHVCAPEFEPENLRATEISPAGPNHWKKIMEGSEIPRSLKLSYVREAPNFVVVGDEEHRKISEIFRWEINNFEPLPSTLEEASKIAETKDPRISSGLRVALANFPSNLLVVLPCSLFIALNNIHVPPDQKIKSTDPNEWDWTREGYKYEDNNFLAFLCYLRGLVRQVEFRECKISKIFDATTDITNLISSTLPQLSEDFHLVQQKFLEFLESCQIIYDTANSEMTEKTLGLRELSEIDRRNFAKNLNQLCPNKGSQKANISQIFFEMKKKGHVHVLQFFGYMDVKKLYFYLMNGTQNTKNLIL